jgi:tryptophan-rich sensory protein
LPEKLHNGAVGSLTLFGVQLVLILAWSSLFFGLQNPGAAFAEVVLHWAAIAATMAAF